MGFPNQNQTRNCWQNYVDFHRCQKLRARSMSHASSSTVTSGPSAPMHGLKSGMSSARRTHFLRTSEEQSFDPVLVWRRFNWNFENWTILILKLLASNSVELRENRFPTA